MALALGLAVALTYGTADFLGGLATRRNPAFAVVALSQTWGVVVLVLALAVDGAVAPTTLDLSLGAAAGVTGLVGVTLLYRALAAGSMGVVAPVTAVGAAVLPLVWGLATGERPSPAALTGVVVALMAVALIAGGWPAAALTGGVPAATAGTGGVPAATAATAGVPSPAPVAATAPARRSHLPLALGAGAGAAFGLLFILLAETSEGAGLSPLLAARAVSVTLISATAVLTRRPLRLAPGTGASVAGAGLLDMAANVLFVLAARRGLLSLVAVLASLYPAATTVLARSVLGERLSPAQVVGLGLALAGLALIAAG